MFFSEDLGLEMQTEREVGQSRLYCKARSKSGQPESSREKFGRISYSTLPERGNSGHELIPDKKNPLHRL